MAVRVYAFGACITAKKRSAGKVKVYRFLQRMRTEHLLQQ